MGTLTTPTPSPTGTTISRWLPRLVLLLLVVSSSVGSPGTATAVDISLTPSVTIHGGSVVQRERLDLALARFAAAGLALPTLEVVLTADTDACLGHLGTFDGGSDPWRITICSEIDFIYEHELAHAWETATLTDEQREAFMDLRGYQVWADAGTPWNERGKEGVAFIIQQSLSGPPLPATLSAEQHSRLTAFELLTGVPDPRLADRGRQPRHRSNLGTEEREDHPVSIDRI